MVIVVSSRLSMLPRVRFEFGVGFGVWGEGFRV